MVTTTIDRKIYSANGVTVAFATDFKFIEDDDVEVYVKPSGGSDTLQTITTHYTVTGAGVDAGGTITFLTAPASGSTVTLKRKTDLTQLVDYIKNDNFPADTHEGAIDKLTLLLQEAYAAISDATNGADPNGLILKYPVSEPTSTSNVLPDKTTRTSKAFIWDSNGEPAVGSATTGVLNDDGTLGGGSPSTSDGATQNAIQTYVAANAPALIGSSVDENLVRFNGTSGQMEDSGLSVIDDDTMATASDTNLSTSEAIVAYIAAQIGSIDTETTGVIKDYVGSTAPSGYVLANGLTIGNASSGATGRANADTEDLFTLLWDEVADSELAVSSGRGASASADYAANKTIELPDLRGRVLAGVDDMGTTDANRLSTMTDSTVLASVGGAETDALSVAMPNQAANADLGAGASFDGVVNSTGYKFAMTGGTDTANVIQPVFLNSKIIKL